MTACVQGNSGRQGASGPVLWLSMAHPGARLAGSSTYSAGLIAAAAEAGLSISLAAGAAATGEPSLRDADAETALSAIETIALPPPRQGRIASLASPLPASAWALGSGIARRTLAEVVKAQEWRAAIVDHASMGWAFPVLKAAGVPFAYVSHNHEASVRPAVAAGTQGGPRRWLVQWDAAKFRRLENALTRNAAFITAISPEDAALYRQGGAACPIVPLLPGYAVPAKAPEPITADTPRRVVLVGRYDWIAKQANLSRWAADGVPLLVHHGIETVVAGHVPAPLVERLAQPGLRFVGEVESLAPVIRDARLGLVPEELGGGFKMKTLEYIFNARPIAALSGSLTGMPNEIQRNTLQADTPAGLATAIIAAIDDLAGLNRMQTDAWQAAARLFDWRSRGAALAAAIGEHCLPSGRLSG